MKRHLLSAFAILLFSLFQLQAQEVRTINGLNNNPFHPDWGATGTGQLMTGTLGYADGVSEPAGLDRPNPRTISNVLFAQNAQTNDPRHRSSFTWAWGQFVDHDIVLSPDTPDEPYPVAVPPYDFYFDPAGSGSVHIPMMRSQYLANSGTDPSNPRTPINIITAFLDASMVYGSDQNTSQWLRMYSKGKLKTSEYGMLPWNTTTSEWGAPTDAAAPGMAMPLPFVTRWFIAGDVRANENPNLTSLHTLFVREHNRICTELLLQHPNWDDEQLYQEARRRVSAEIQAITYEEWLPTMGVHLEPYSGYKTDVNPQIMNVFSVAGFRFGHTAINNMLFRMDNEGEHMPEGDIMLRDAYFNPQAVREVDGIEPYLIGMSVTVQQNVDCKVIDDLRNFLFGPPGAGGLDLVSINIQRGRERGLPDYNTLRQDLGMPKATSFMNLTDDMLMALSLQNLYGTPDKMDVWVGLLAEDHMPDAQFGPTAMAVITQQFVALRDGDRFYYENDPALNEAEIQTIKATRLADVIRRNSAITCLNDDVFVAQPLAITPVADAAIQQSGLEVFPNPAQDYLNVRFNAAKSQIVLVRVSDLSGRIVMNESVQVSQGENTVEIRLNGNLPSGLYQLVLNTETTVSTTSFVKK